MLDFQRLDSGTNPRRKAARWFARLIVGTVASAVLAGAPLRATAQGGGIQYSTEDTRHFEGERFVTLLATRILTTPSAEARIVRDLPRMHMVYAKPTADPRWLEVTGASAEPHPYERQGMLQPVRVKDGKLNLRLKRIDRNVYFRIAGYVEAARLGSLDRPLLLPTGLVDQTVPIPGPLVNIGVPERRFVPKRPLDSPFRSVVRIVIGPGSPTDKYEYYSCTGFVTGRTGLIATSGHCFQDGRDKHKISVMLPSPDNGYRQAVPVPAKLIYWVREQGKENAEPGGTRLADSALLEVTDPRIRDLPPLTLASPGSWLQAGSVEVMTLGFGMDLDDAKAKWLKSDAVVHGDICVLTAGQLFLGYPVAPLREIGVVPTNMDCVLGQGDSGGPLLFWNDKTAKYEVMGIASFGSNTDERESAMTSEARALLGRERAAQEREYGHAIAEGRIQGTYALTLLLDRSSQTYQGKQGWQIDERLYQEVANRSGQLSNFQALWLALLTPSPMLGMLDRSTRMVNNLRELNRFRLARLRLPSPLNRSVMAQAQESYGDKLDARGLIERGIPLVSYRLGQVLDVGKPLVLETELKAYATELQPEVDAMVKAKPILANSLPREFARIRDYRVVEAGDDLYVLRTENNEVIEVVRRWMNRYEGDLGAVRLTQGYSRSIETDPPDPVADDADAPASSSAFRTGTLSGLTPSRIQGAITVSPAAVWQSLLPGLQRKGSTPILLSALPHGHGVPTALDASFAASGTGLSDAAQGRLIAALNQRGVAKSQPIFVYGDSAESWDAHNLVLRLLSAGYSQVSWMRFGIEGWVYAGLPLGVVAPL